MTECEKPAMSRFVYVIYIRTTPEALWSALTDARVMPRYWFGIHAESGFRTGDAWRLVDGHGEAWDEGEILEADPPRKLAIRWTHLKKPELAAEGPSSCTMELAPEGQAVKLTVTHAIERADSKLIEAVSTGWPVILSNLKSLLETGAIATGS